MELGLPYNRDDLNLFFSSFIPELVGRPPSVTSIDGGGEAEDEYSQPETVLGLDITMSLTYPLHVTLYQVGSLPICANDFLDAIEESYCTFEGGDDPNVDPVFPNKHYDGTM